jgi:hypothetical protein
MSVLVLPTTTTLANARSIPTLPTETAAEPEARLLDERQSRANY